MKLITFRQGTKTKAGRVQGDEVVELGYKDVGALLNSDWTKEGLKDGPKHSLDSLDLAPSVLNPSKIICVGHNYASHVKEQGLKWPEFPTLFAKYSDSLIGAHDNLVLSKLSQEMDWEVELVVVIGKTAREVSVSQADDYIAGFSVMNDISVRDWQFRTGQFLQGKTFDASSPLGPLVTKQDLDYKKGLELRCQIDDTQVQQGNTSDLIFSPAELVSYISSFTRLNPGDLISTGTPGGVGHWRNPPVYLQAGQVLKTWVEGVGELINPVLAP